jgi:hypothetical protein
MYNNNNMFMNQSTHLSLLDLKIMLIVTINPKSILKCQEAVAFAHVGPNLVCSSGDPKHKTPGNIGPHLDLQ